MMVRDEEKRIASSIANLQLYVDDVFILDGGSTDKTVAIAKDMGARVKVWDQGERNGEYGSDGKGADWNEKERRELMLDEARYNKVLVLDADELIAAPKDFFRYNDCSMALPRYNLATLQHAIPGIGNGWWPDFCVRFIKKGTRYSSGQIHIGPIVDDCLFMNMPIFHYKRIREKVDTTKGLMPISMHSHPKGWEEQCPWLQGE